MLDALLERVNVLCEGHAHEVNGSLDGYRLLAAIAVVESTGGRNNYPNFEPYWIPEGEGGIVENSRQTGRHPKSNAVVVDRFAAYGLAAGCSFSSWQILYHTAADLGFVGQPWDLWDDEVAVEWVVKLLNRICSQGATTVEEVADAWNSGTFKDTIIPERYIEKFTNAYNALYEGEAG